jgi:hypothetical protein
MRDDEVFAAVRALVEQGEYLDTIPGVPGAALSGGGAFQESRDGVRRRLYTRGTPEYVEARAAGLVERLPPLTAAPASAIADAESGLGYPFPALLRRLYAELGNGGFGPGYGLLGLAGGHTDGGKTALAVKKGWKALPPALLPICTWGCGIYSFLDCSTPDGPMWAWDPNPVSSDELDSALFAQDTTFSAWLGRWTEGLLFQPTLTHDPVTGDWRGATDEEQLSWMAEE